MLNKGIAAALVAWGLSVASAADAAPIVYTGAQQVGSIAASWSIRTDGTLGASVSASHIDDWSVTLADAAGNLSYAKGDAGAMATGTFGAGADSLFVTPGGGLSILFAPTAAPTALLQIQAQQTTAQLATGGTTRAAFVASNNFVAFATAATTAAVPEPATWAMMIVGVGAVGGAARRRRRPVAAIA